MGTLGQIVKDLEGGMDIDLNQSTVHMNQDTAQLSVCLQIGDDLVDLRVTNFRAGFAIEQTVRDINGSGMPRDINAFKGDISKPLVLESGDETIALTAKDPEAQLLFPLGRLYTTKTP